MIEAVTGFPGSGKSVYCSYQTMKALKQGRKVFINIPVRGAYKITFDDLIKYRFPKGSLVIIDEGGRWFNSRKWKDLPSEVFDLFTLHRHMGLDLIVAVQNFNRIDVALREVIELVWWARNNPILPFYMYDGYYDVEAMGLKGQSQHKSYIWRWSKARKLYDTHAMSKAFENKDDMPLIPWIEETPKKPFKERLKEMFQRKRKVEPSTEANAEH